MRPRGENVHYDDLLDRHEIVVAAKRKLDAQVVTLAAELAVAQQTNREWLAANAPGGWIDNLRKGLTAETKGDASGG